MKKIFLFFIISFLLMPLNIYAQEFNLKSKSAILINLNDDKVLYEKNIDNKTYIASLTKIMTAVVVLDSVNNLEEKIKLEKSDFNNLAKYDASISNLSVGSLYTYEDLLYGLLLSSGADCANALARKVGSNIDAFVKMMNEKAKSLGMNNTNFSNPIGLDDENNYSTVSDLVILFKYALSKNSFANIIKTMSYKTMDNHILTHTIDYYKTKYKLKMDYLVGGKTGNDIKAGFCLASIATYNDVNYMLITLNATYSNKTPNHFIDAETIYKYFMDNYNYHILIKKDESLIELNTLYAKKDKITIKSDKNYEYYVENNYDKEKLTFKYDGIDIVKTNMKQNEKLGILSVYYNSQLLDKIDIYLPYKLKFSLIAFLIVNPIIIYIFIVVILIIFFVSLFFHELKKRKNLKLIE